MLTIATHSGSFHSDDVFAVATLQLLHGVSNINVVRTRDEAILATADIVVDVGGVYDPTLKRFYHHQPGAPIRDNGIPYAAFGLVWREYGALVVGHYEIAEEIEQKIVLAVDAGDTGISLYIPNDSDIVPYELYQVISSFHPVWGSADSKDEAFMTAVTFARELLERLIKYKLAEVAMKELVALAKSRPCVLQRITIRRRAFSRLTAFGPTPSPMSANFESSTWPRLFGRSIRRRPRFA